MKFDPDIHQRRSICLAGYDYTTAGGYFVTFCVQGRECLLGKIVEDRVVLNDAGRKVEKIWMELPLDGITFKIPRNRNRYSRDHAQPFPRDNHQ
ncbi:MAG: hypothetical protein L3J57_12645 [Desulfuromusa sp.]|nr:hypothetical protein [Desulfuromusa sp.]